MSQFVIAGHKKLSGNIPVYGSKNAALPLLAAALLTADPVTYSNIPDILDVDNLLTIMRAMGVKVKRENGQITITAENVMPEQAPPGLIGQLRGSILLMGALLGRLRRVSLPLPGGDVIGSRPIDAHLSAFEELGATVREADGLMHIDGTFLRAGIIVLPEFSVTATENAMMAAATLEGKTTIHTAAAEPHIVALAELLQKMGAKVAGAGTHVITVEGSTFLTGAEHTNIQDMLEAGTFMLLAAATGSQIKVQGAPLDDLKLFLKKMEEAGVRYTVNGSDVTVEPSKLKSIKLQTLPHPGLPTDLQAPFSVLATQAEGSSLIHDPMYEGRFKYAEELQKMGAKITMCDPHRIMVHGPTKLYGSKIKSLDIRAGITLIIAALTAEGESVIDNAETVDRGYAHLTERLQNVGARIWRRD